jgi:cytochrome c oxidase cbb3-type subunit 3
MFGAGMMSTLARRDETVANYLQSSPAQKYDRRAVEARFMKTNTLRTAAFLLLLGTGVALAAYGRPQARGGLTSFPAQQRPPGDAELIKRGNALYGIHCRSCHGGDLRGGEAGGSNLLRSSIVLNDQAGERIAPVIREGRQMSGSTGMPPIALNPDETRAIAEYLHSILATARGQGSPPAGPPVDLKVLVGDPVAGRAYFETKCSRCHSATGDLSGIAARLSDPVQLQNFWVAGGAAGGRGAGPTRVTATVTLPTGEKVEGRLGRIDDFVVVLNLPDDTSRSFRRVGDVPRVEIRDPREPHRQLWPEYRDQDIHNVTAFLATLK